MIKKIFIITGPVQSGKTTFLMDLFKDRLDTDGFLCPDFDNRRFFFDLDTKELKEFEVSDESAPTDLTRIGKFVFRSEIFTTAKMKIENARHKVKSFFIVDEIGKLELKNQGLEPELYKLLHSQSLVNTILILVVRDYLLEAVIRKYDLNTDEIINVEIKAEHQKLNQYF